MARGRRLAPDSIRDTEWQRREYRRLMGDEAADRQELLAKQANGECTCRRRTLKTRGSFRTVHQRDCIKYKPWMEEYLTRVNPAAAAHAASARDDNVRPPDYTPPTTSVPVGDDGSRTPGEESS